MPLHTQETGTEPLRCVYAASEVAGFAKTGGLADVAGALPRALAERGIDCAVILPLYRCARTGAQPVSRTNHSFPVPVGDRTVQATVWQSRLPDSNVAVYLIDQPGYFDRDDASAGRGLYQFTGPDGRRGDYADNCERFVFFSRAILETIRHLELWPDVLHVNDWQTGLVPVYLKEDRRYSSEPAGERYRRIRTLLTIHNLAYQGVFWHLDLPLTGLHWELFTSERLEFYGHLNLLKAGIVDADLLNTVSPMYAREIQTPYFGCGLQGVLAQRQHDLFGIVNGVDYRIWNPATDAHLAANYDDATLTAGKPRCKAALQQHYALEQNPRTLLLGMVSRLVDQKGLDILGDSAQALLQRQVQLVILGEGDPKYEDMLLSLRAKFPRQVGVTLAQDEKLAHQIEAGADVFLMPSQFEPCGLSQLYSLKYGTVPVVRRTGGLADTVVDATPETLAAGTATGFSFVAHTAAAFLETADRALDLYRQHPESWLALQRTGMRQDWSWNHSAAEYEKVYQSLVSRT